MAVHLGCALLSGCAAATTTVQGEEEQPRLAELVDEEVVRRVDGEPDEALEHARRTAVLEVAEALEPLQTEEVAALRLDVSLTFVTDSDSTFRVRALVAVHTVGPPERMRAMLQGTGTVQRGTNRSADLRLAAEGAVRGALRRLLQVYRRLS